MTKITPHDINYSSMGLEIGYLYHVYFFLLNLPRVENRN